ncbi:hypothetical protein WUBG_16079 [Wuchereria bancrofti]|uniref:SH2 domain-containing protein n=1 Tax=Wuchereria bancrofti TaxID=6293 RepID=J9DTN1_WUCBA|nr:hypothetical protein WUBG_16079 [Wuchereria bancrofti]
MLFKRIRILNFRKMFHLIFNLFDYRNRIIDALLEQPEGAFVVRFSESKRKCLALSVRVPFRHNPTGVSHYLITKKKKNFFNKLFETKQKKKK